MKKFVSTIIILFYEIASIGFGSIHYYCNMSINNPDNASKLECACSVSHTEHVSETNSCHDTDDAAKPIQDPSGQSDHIQYVMDCCSIELSYYQSDDVVLNINDFQKCINTENFSNLFFSVQIESTRIADNILLQSTSQHRNLPLLI